MCAVRALCPVPSGFSSGLAPAGRWGRPRRQLRADCFTPPEGASWGRTVAISPQRSPCCGFHSPPLHPPPPYPPGPLLSGTHDASRNASGLNLALENYTGEPTAPGDKPS